jgi:hypothetical protein
VLLGVALDILADAGVERVEDETEIFTVEGPAGGFGPMLALLLAAPIASRSAAAAAAVTLAASLAVT